MKIGLPAGYHVILTFWLVQVASFKKAMANNQWIDLPCVSVAPGRLNSTERLLSLIAHTPNYERIHLGEAQKVLGDIVVNSETFNLSVRGVGFFPGLEDVIEYNNLARPSINNDQISITDREIMDIKCINRDTLTVYFREQFEALKGSLVSFQDESYDLRFKPDSPLVFNYTARLPPNLIDAYAAEVYDAKHICDAATTICVGDLFPYESLDECYHIMTSLPVDCEPKCYDCYEKNAPFQGDTRLCRSLHLLSAQLRPTFHCAHMADISTKCYAEQCPSVKRKTPEEVDELLKFFDAGLPPVVETVEFITALLLLMAPFATYICFLYQRRSTFIEKRGEEGESLMRGLASLPVEEQPDLSEESGRSKPWMRCGLELRRMKNNTTVFRTESVDFGGCKLTALDGPSGCGKSTMMRLICGFVQPHMELKMDLKSPPCNVAYTSQSADLWPKYMKVRDIFLFASTLQKTQVKDYEDCIHILSVGDLMDNTFGSLSGGEQRRVHCLASMMRPTPTLLFMDEPLSGLDEKNAVIFIELLKKLPVEHTFCLSIHQMSPRIERLMDRVITLNDVEKNMFVIHRSTESYNIAKDMTIHELSENQISKAYTSHVSSFWASFKAMIILWHGQYMAIPVIEIGTTFCNGFTAMLVGIMAKQSLYGSDEEHIPASQSVRIPVMLLQMFCNLLVITSFGVSMIYAMMEKDLISYVIGQKDMRPSALVALNFFRLCFHGLVATAVQFGIFMACTSLGDKEWDLIIINSGLLLTGCLIFLYSVAVIFPPYLASQVVLLVILPMMFFSGVFFLWSGLEPLFQIAHYLSPLFYCLHACANLLLDGFEGKCDDKASPFLECANRESIVEIAQIRKIPSSWSQLVSTFWIILGLIIMSWHFRYRQSIKPMIRLNREMDGNSNREMDGTMQTHMTEEPVLEKLPEIKIATSLEI